MVWKPTRRPKKYEWRNFLTAEEKATIAKIDKLEAELRALRGNKNLIMNRAIQRAKYEASRT
jgi:hypothetical protein